MPVEVRLEVAALLGELAHLRERKDLEAAGVREDRAVPPHEPVQTAGGGDDLRPRPQHEVVGVAEDDLRLQRDEVARLQRLDGAERPDVHEHGRLDDPVRGREPPQPRLGARILF